MEAWRKIFSTPGTHMTMPLGGDKELVHGAAAVVLSVLAHVWICCFNSVTRFAKLGPRRMALALVSMYIAGSLTYVMLWPSNRERLAQERGFRPPAASLCLPVCMRYNLLASSSRRRAGRPYS